MVFPRNRPPLLPHLLTMFTSASVGLLYGMVATGCQPIFQKQVGLGNPTQEVLPGNRLPITSSSLDRVRYLTNVLTMFDTLPVLPSNRLQTTSSSLDRVRLLTNIARQQTTNRRPLAHLLTVWPPLSPHLAPGQKPPSLLCCLIYFAISYIDIRFINSQLHKYKVTNTIQNAMVLHPFQMYYYAILYFPITCVM